MSEVDYEKYPDIKCEYRFETVEKKNGAYVKTIEKEKK